MRVGQSPLNCYCHAFTVSLCDHSDALTSLLVPVAEAMVVRLPSDLMSVRLCCRRRRQVCFVCARRY